MIYRRVMRTPSLQKLTAPLAGVVLVLAGCGAEENAPPAATGPCAIVENGTTAPETSQAAGSRPEVATGYRKDMTAVRHRALCGRHCQPAGHAGGLRGAEGRRHRGRRARRRPGGARPGRAAVVRDRRRRVPALLRRQGQLRTGLRRQGDRSRRGRRELPALDLRHRSHRAQAGRKGLRPLHRSAGHPAAADGRPQAARQDRVARPVRSCRDARRRRLRHQPAAGCSDRRRCADS